MDNRIKLPRLNGSWEKPGRSPAIAALIIVLVLGSLYFMVGNIASLGVIAVRALGNIARGETDSFLKAFGGGVSGKDFMENMRRSYAENRVWILALTDVCQYLVFFLAGLAVSRKWFSSDVAAYSGYKRASLPGVLAGIAGGLLVLPIVDAISKLTDFFFPTFAKYGELSAALYQWGSPLEAIFVFFSISITPAICEEFIFRGVFQRGLQRKLAFPWSFIVSGVVFAVFHQSALATPALVPVGVLLGFMYWAFDSIWPGMALHAAYNGAILLLTNKALPLPASIVDGNYLSWPVWIAGFCGLAVLCFFVGKRALGEKGKAARDDGLTGEMAGPEAAA